jgi:protein gp37
MECSGMFANSLSDWFHQQVVHKGVSQVTPVMDVYHTFSTKKQVSGVLSWICLRQLRQSRLPRQSHRADDTKFVRVHMAVGHGDCNNSRKFAKIGDKYNIMLIGC